MSKFAIFVDVQVGFTTGALRNDSATKRLPYLETELARLVQADYKFAFTEDSHPATEIEYQRTLEGQFIPYHCGDGSADQQTVEPLRSQLYEAGAWCVRKDTFGARDLVAYLQRQNLQEPIEEIRFYGFVTEICVVSNVLLVRAFFPNLRIIVDATGCAGLTKDGHQAALTVMRANLIEIINE
jgi:nicotinamidase-related amidase